MDDEIPEHGDSHASSSHEASLEPTFKRREDSCKHTVYTHFPKDRNCEICKRLKLQGPHAEDAMVKPYLVLKILVIQQILWNVTPICETSQIYHLMGRPVKDVLGNHVQDRLLHFVEYHPKTAKDQSRIHQFGKSLTWIVSRIRIVRGWNLEG